MIFSPAYISALLVRPLRYFYENHAPQDLRWSDDVKKSQIEIDTINNFNKHGVELKPRILVSRGQYSVKPVGLTDNLAQGRGIYASQGTRNSTNMLLIDGVAQILIEARNEGTCEKIVDLTQHFIAWSGPLIAEAHGFKMSFLPLNVSTCTPSREDTEIFTCTINLPWTKEEHYKTASGDDIKLKNFLLTITP